MPSILKRLLLPFLGAFALAAVAVPALRADDNDSKDNEPTLSEFVGDGLEKVPPLLNNHDFAGAIALVESLLQKSEPGSYDAAILYRTEAQIFTQKSDYAAAIEPLEKLVAITDHHKYFTTKEVADFYYFLSQLFYQQADSYKNDHAAELTAYSKAIEYIKRWFAVAAKPTEDNTYYYAQLLYSYAIAQNPKSPDPELIKQAQEQVVKTLEMSVHPKDTMYMFLLATLQQEQNYARSAEIIELLLSHNPNNKTYWQDLNMFYMALAQDPKVKDERTIREYNIRAINTIERAQARGFLKTPHDYFILFTLYYNIGQYGTAADILHEGLRTGNIENELSNWTLLAASYQQINKDFAAIEVLKEAADKFPKNGELDFKVAQIYQGLDDNANAYKFGLAAINKGDLAKPSQTYLFLAYVAYELSKWDEAKAAIDKSIEFTGKADHQANGLKAAIEEAIKERDAKKAETAAAAAPTASN